jgi:hypothetical protein
MEELMVPVSSLLCQSFVVQENVRRVTHKYPKKKNGLSVVSETDQKL